MIGRPEKDEAAEFYWTYIDKVPGGDAVRVMEQQVSEWEALLAGVGEEGSLYRYAPGKWSIRETVNHVSDNERALVFRALWFGRGLEGALPGFDENIAAAGSGADSVSLAEHLEEFKRVRLATISLFNNLPDEAWMRVGVANERKFSVRALAFIVAGHAAHHLGILRERYSPGFELGRG